MQPRGNEMNGGQISGNQKARFSMDADCKCYVESLGMYYAILNTKKMKIFFLHNQTVFSTKLEYNYQITKEEHYM